MTDKDKEFIEIINQQLLKKNVYLLNEIFGKFTEISKEKALYKISLSLNTNLLNVKFSKLSVSLPNYWKQVDQNFPKFNIKQQRKVIEYIEKYIGDNNPVSIYMIHILLINSESFNDEEKISYYETYLKGVYSNEFYDFSIDNEILKGMWFINEIENKNNVYLKCLENQNFKFDNILFDKLLDILNRMDKGKMYDDYTFLIENTSINLLEYVLKNDKLELKENQKEKLLNVRIIQRIYANLALDGLNIDEYTIKAIINNVDTYKFYGSEMNDFLRKFDSNYSKPKDYYVDGIYSIPDEELNREATYIPIPKFDNKNNIDGFTSKLYNYTIDSSRFKGDFTEYDQGIELADKLTKSNPWENDGDNVIYFLNKLINDSTLRNTYEMSISKIICYGINNGFLDNNFVKSFFDINKHMEKNIFNSYDSSIFEEIIKKKINNDLLDLLFYIAPNKLNVKYGNENNISKNIKLNEFINTDLGRYAYILKKLPKEILIEKKEKIIRGITSLDEKYKNYMTGMFLPIFKFNNVDFNSINTFSGYSHNYNMPTDSPYLKEFSNLVKNVFMDTEPIDSFSMRNVCLVLVMEINPEVNFDNEKLESLINGETIFRDILVMFFISKNDLGFRSNWINVFLESGKYNNILISFIVRNLYEMDLTNLNKLNNLLRVNISKNIEVVKNTIFSYIPNIEKIDVQKIDILINLFLFTLDKNLIDRGFYFIQSIEQFLSELKKGNFELQLKHVMNGLVGYLTPSDLNDLKTKFSDN